MLEPINPDEPDKFRAFFGPGQLDSQLRNLIQMCWMTLPEEKKTIDGLEGAFRYMVDRAFRDLREDQKLFGLPE